MLRVIFSEGYGDQTSGKLELAATREEAVRHAHSLSDTLALTYCPHFGAANFRQVKSGKFTGVVGYHRDGTPIACIIRGIFQAVGGINGTEERGYVSIASVYSLVPKSL